MSWATPNMLRCDASSCTRYVVNAGPENTAAAAVEQGWHVLDEEDVCPDHPGELGEA